MKKSCGRCGRIHSKGECTAKPPPKTASDAVRLRSSSAWRKMRKSIRQRDNGLCQICVRNLYETRRIYNTFNLDVHHIIPLTADYSRGLDTCNLITLCDRHHEMADNGTIPVSLLSEIVASKESVW